MALDGLHVSTRTKRQGPVRCSVADGDRVSLGDRTDLELVAGLCDGRGDAYSEIYRRHRNVVTSSAEMILARDPRCEAVVAQVSSSLWFFPEDFDPSQGTLLAYLRLEARDRSIDLVRSVPATRPGPPGTGRSRVETGREPPDRHGRPRVTGRPQGTPRSTT
jgi:hypothetical protein